MGCPSGCRNGSDWPGSRLGTARAHARTLAPEPPQRPCWLDSLLLCFWVCLYSRFSPCAVGRAITRPRVFYTHGRERLTRLENSGNDTEILPLGRVLDSC